MTLIFTSREAADLSATSLEVQEIQFQRQSPLKIEVEPGQNIDWTGIDGVAAIII